MGGYAIVFGQCCGCGVTIGFNPHKVPSFRVNGVLEPACQSCVGKHNDARIATGLDAIPVQPGAYEALPEEEL